MTPRTRGALGIGLVAVGSAVGAYFARHDSSLLRTAAAVAGTITVLVGAVLIDRSRGPVAPEPRPDDR